MPDRPVKYLKLSEPDRLIVNKLVEVSEKALEEAGFLWGTTNLRIRNRLQEAYSHAILYDREIR